MIKKLIISAIVLGGLSALVLSPTSAEAFNIFNTACNGAGGNPVCDAQGDQLPALLQNVINTLFYLIGIVAVIFIIIGGFRYVTSNGDSSQLTSAKNTILYAVVGLVVAVGSFAIVNFVLTSAG